MRVRVCVMTKHFREAANFTTTIANDDHAGQHSTTPIYACTFTHTHQLSRERAFASEFSLSLSAFAFNDDQVLARRARFARTVVVVTARAMCVFVRALFITSVVVVADLRQNSTHTCCTRPTGGGGGRHALSYNIANAIHPGRQEFGMCAQGCVSTMTRVDKTIEQDMRTKAHSL